MTVLILCGIFLIITAQLAIREGIIAMYSERYFASQQHFIQETPRTVLL